MSFILHPINYAIQRTVNAVLKTPESGARVTGQTVDDNVATRINLQPEELAFDPDRGFKPTFYTGLTRPKVSARTCSQEVTSGLGGYQLTFISSPLP